MWASESRLVLFLLLIESYQLNLAKSGFTAQYLDESQLKFSLFSVLLKSILLYKGYLLQNRGEIHTDRPFHSLRSDW